MKKINITLIMLLALALVFTGCRGEGGEDTTAPPTETILPETTTEEISSEPIIEYNGSRGLLYEIAEDGKSAYLSGIGSCTDADITVASLYGGLPVTAIGKSAFYNQQQIKSITVPESVQRIEEGAFSNCKGLKSIVLHDGITFIGEFAFDYCVSLMSISLPKGLTRLEAGVLSACKDLAEIEIPESVTEIAAGAFLGCTLLETVKIPANVKKISNLAFSQCRLLTVIDFGGTSEEWASVEKEMGWDYESTILSVRCTDGEIDPIGSIGLEFRTFADYAVVVGIGTCEDSEVIIPATYNGLPVTEIWDRAFYQVKGMTSVTIPEGVTYIESEAFLNCPDLREIHLPASLENVTGSLSIGFMNCPSLEVIEVAEGNEKYFAKNNCLIEKSTGKLVLGGRAQIPADGSVKSIGAHAFAGNLLLKSVKIPEGVTDIYTSAFEGCTNLASITLPKTLKTVRQSAFKGCTALASIVIPDSVNEICNAAFSDCNNLKNVTLSKNLTLIDSEAFKACAIESIEIPAGVKELGAAFSECEKLKNVTLPESFERFVGHTFAGCTALESINLPASLNHLGFFTFKNCAALKELNFGGTVSEWNAVYKQESWNDDAAFVSVKCSNGEVKLYADAADGGSAGLEYEIDGYGAVLVSIGNCTDKDIVIAPTFGGMAVTRIDASAFSGCDFIESVVIPEGVTIISNEAFYLCKNLKKVTLPSTLDIIGSWAFANCENLEKVAIPNGIMIIEQRAFSDCVKLSSLTLGKDLERIEENAFMNCSSLKSVTIPSKVIYFGNSAFLGCSSLEKATLTKGIEMIGDSVFADCPKLTAINFTGKIADWEKLVPSPHWMKGSSIERVICSDGDARLKDSFDGTPGLTYSVAKDGKSAFLAGIGVFSGSEIVVATEFNGLPVTSIAYRVINNAPNLTSIHISKTVTDLPKELFYQCDKILSLTVDPENPVYMSEGNCIIERKTGKLLYGCNGSVIPDGVKIIGESAFASCTSLTSLTVPEGVEVIEPRAFSSCTALSSITLPESLVSVGEFAFSNSTSLESITFGSKIKTIDRNAFSGCTGLKKVDLPDTVTLGRSVFQNCSSLQSIKLPAALTSLCGTFFGCSSLESVVLPEKLTSLFGSTFSGCTSLKNITLPASVREINGSEFKDCVSLTDFTFGGTVAEWNAIFKQYWREGAPFSTVKCSDGTVRADEVDEYEAIEIAREYWKDIISDGCFISIKCHPTHEEPCFTVVLARKNDAGRYPIEAEILIDRATGNITPPDYSYPDIPTAIMDVLMNRSTLAFTNHEGTNDAYFKDIFLWADCFGATTETFSYSVCDLDSEGEKEVILLTGGNTIILRVFGEKVYGTEYPNNAIPTLFSDGSYTYRVNSGIKEYTSMITFDGAETKSVTILLHDRGTQKYYVEGREVTQAEYKAREALLSTEKLEFEPLDLYPLEIYPPN